MKTKKTLLYNFHYYYEFNNKVCIYWIRINRNVSSYSTAAMNNAEKYKSYRENIFKGGKEIDDGKKTSETPMQRRWVIISI